MRRVSWQKDDSGRLSYRLSSFDFHHFVARQGKPEEGAIQLQHALDAQKRIGFEVGRSFYLTLLAEVHCMLRQREQGLAAVAEGLERVEQKGERFYAAELYRLKGQLTLQSQTSPNKSWAGLRKDG